MKNKDRLQDELSEQAPFLNSLEKGKNDYKVPDRYFDNLEAEVYRQIEAIGATRKPAPPVQRPSFWQFMQSLWQPRTALAFAGFLALAMTAWWYFQTNSTPADFTAAAITADDAEAYLLDNLMELEPEHIAMVLPEDNLPPITIEAPVQKQSGAAPSIEEIEIHPEDLEDLLLDMTDEELKELML